LLQRINYLKLDYIREGKERPKSEQQYYYRKGCLTKCLLIKGDIIKISTSNGNLASLKIVGISEIGIAEIDNVMSYTSLSTAQKLLGQPKVTLQIFRLISMIKNRLFR
jgi:lipoprotein-releasing system permease protein